MSEIKFEKFERPDGLEEERVVKAGEENFPLRRAVGEKGMQDFGTEAEKQKYLDSVQGKGVREDTWAETAARERRREWERLRIELTEDLQELFEHLRGDPGLGHGIMTLLRTQPLLKHANVTLLIAHDYQGFTLEIPSRSRGNMQFAFGSSKTETETVE